MAAVRLAIARQGTPQDPAGREATVATVRKGVEVSSSPVVQEGPLQGVGVWSFLEVEGSRQIRVVGSSVVLG